MLKSKKYLIFNEGKNRRKPFYGFAALGPSRARRRYGDGKTVWGISQPTDHIYHLVTRCFNSGQKPVGSRRFFDTR